MNETKETGWQWWKAKWAQNPAKSPVLEKTPWQAWVISTVKKGTK